MRTTATLFLITLAAGAFAPAANAQRYYDSPGAGVECRSRDRNYNECWTGFRGRVDLVRQISKTTCVEGRNWGVRRGYVWVDGGCGGIFAESRGGGWGGGDHRPGYGGGGYEYTVQCKSRDFNRSYCPADVRRGGVEIVDQLSDSPCIEGRTWGWDRRGIWVDEGCEGVFAVGGR